MMQHRYAHALALAALTVLLQPAHALALIGDGAPQERLAPVVIPLRREVTPVLHGGKVVSYKTAYSGLLHVGFPNPVEMRVVFDTGSGHLVLPAANCLSKACFSKQRYTPSLSNMSPEEMNTVTIGFGTGKLRGSLVSDLVCVGAAPADGVVIQGNCVQSGIVAAWEMSDEPFLSFPFDGILGLGLKSLAVLEDFSFTTQFFSSGNWYSGQFAVLLSRGNTEGDSEISFGGYNPDHLLEPLTWVPLAKPELGYWMVDLLNVYVGDTRLDVCSDGPCVAILDTGTSHLAVPEQHLDTFEDLLAWPATGLSDCRLARAPSLTVEMRGWNLTMPPEMYMRQLPVRPSMLNASTSRADGTAPSKAPDEEELACTARLMSVVIPQIGPNMFILGEPALQRYYTVYDAQRLQVGLGLAKQRKPKRPDASNVKKEAKEVVRDEVFLLQH